MALGIESCQIFIKVSLYRIIRGYMDAHVWLFPTVLVISRRFMCLIIVHLARVSNKLHLVHCDSVRFNFLQTVFYQVKYEICMKIA